MTVILASLLTLLFTSPTHAQELREARISYGVRPDDFDSPQDPVDEQVRLREPLAPVYPDAAMRRALEGIAVIATAVDADGVLTYAELRRSSGHPELDSAALAAVRGGDFIPARRDGRRVAARITIPVEFRLARSHDVEKTNEQLRQESGELDKAKRMIDDEQRAVDEELRRLRASQKPKK